MSETNIKLETQVIVELARNLRTISLYGVAHPSTKESIQTLLKIFEQFFEKNSALEVSIQDDKLLILGKPIEDKSPVFRSFVQLLDKMGLLSLTFNQGMTEEELLSFVKILTSFGQKDKPTESIEEILKKESVVNIRANIAIYTKAGKDQTKPQKAVEGESDDLVAKFKSLSYDKRVQFFSRFLDDHETISHFVRQGRESKEPSDTPQILESICDAFVQKSSKASANSLKILKSFSVFKEQAIKILAEKERTEPQPILQKTYDLLRAQMIASQYLQADQSKKTIAEIVKDWISSPEEMWRLIPEIKKILAQKGLENVTLSEISQAFGEVPQIKEGELTEKIHGILEQVLGRGDSGPIESSIMNTVSQFVSSEIEKNSKELRGAYFRMFQEKQRMEMIFENTSEGLMVTDSEGKIRFLNPAARAILGLGPNDPIDPDLLQRIVPGQVIAKTALKEGGVAGGTWEVQIMGDASSQKTLRESMSVIRNEEGQITGSIFVLSDITRQREMIKNKADLFSKVAYEMRNSLATLKESINLFSQGREEITEDQKELLAISERGIQRLTESLNRILQPAEREKKEAFFTKEWVQLNTLIERTLLGMDSWIASKKIKLDFSLPKEEVLLELDLERFLDLFHALIAFNIKITQAGEKNLIKAMIPIDRPDVVEIHFQNLSSSEETLKVLKSMQSCGTPEQVINFISNIIGIKLPRALEALQMEGIEIKVAEAEMCLSIPIP